MYALRYCCGLLIRVVAASPCSSESLAGTDSLTAQGDLAEQMVARIDKFPLREIAAARDTRELAWKREFSDPKRAAGSARLSGPQKHRNFRPLN